MPSETRHVLGALIDAALSEPLPTRSELAALIGTDLRARACTIDPPSGTTGPRRRGGRCIRLEHDGSCVGFLRLALPRRPATCFRSRDLTHRVASVLGPVLYAVDLRLTLQQRQTELAALAPHDPTRPALDRALRADARRYLAALRVAVGVLDRHVAGVAEDLAGGLAARLTSLLPAARMVGDGTAAGEAAPASLLADGLVAAVDAELATDRSVSVTAEAAIRRRRYPWTIESGVFDACAEAVGNAARHAPGAAVEIDLEHTLRGLRFAIRDHGPGFDATALDPTSSLVLLGDRIAAIGGELTVRTRPGLGTVVAGFIPL